jgi:hypothetical protein
MRTRKSAALSLRFSLTFAVGAQLADPTKKIAGRVIKAFLTDADVARLRGDRPV